MWDGEEFREVVSGRRRGVRASLMRQALRVAETPYSWAVKLRNHRYDHKEYLTHRVDVPVISVGNLTLGGTGKTPVVAWLARWFAEQGVRIALVSRGYGARGTRPIHAAHGGSHGAESGPDFGAKQRGPNDEARELAQQLPGVPHVQDPDRVRAAIHAIREYQAQLILLDDGFQHRRLARDLDVVLIDALEPYGFGHVFPRGTLREPLGGMARADVVALSRSDMANTARIQSVHETVRHLAPTATWCELVHAPRALVNAAGQRTALSTLAGKRLAAFSGIGNPRGFRHSLDACGYNVCAFRNYPDHFPYPQTELEDLARWSDQMGVDAVICTHKDLVKLGTNCLGSRPVFALAIEIELVEGFAELTSRLRQLLARYQLPH